MTISMETLTSKPVVVDDGTKRDLIVLLYKSLEPLTGYGNMHKAAQKYQNMLETKHNISFGYKFEDGGVSSIYDIWDDDFQEDIEIYDAVGEVVDNADVPAINDPKGPVTHELQVKSRPKGEFLLRTDIKDNLSQYGGIEILKREISENCR